MRVKSIQIVAATGIVLCAVLPGAPAAGAVTGAVEAPPDRALASDRTAPDLLPGARQRASWTWIGGAREPSRSYDSVGYASRLGEIGVVVTVYPTLPRRYVDLEVYQDGRWITESRGRTSRSGRLRLLMSPYCADGSWCNGTYRYRLRMLAANGRPGWRDTVWVTFNDGGTPTPAPDPTPTPSPTTQPSGAWAGTWCSGSAQWGTVVLTQSGLNVSGTFANGVGQVAMTSSGDSMTGTWTRSASDGWPTNGGVTVTRTGTDGAGNALYSQDITYAGGYSPSTGVTWRAGPCAG